MTHNLQPAETCGKRTTKQPISWLICQKCGLIALRNEATKKALRAKCPGLEDQQP